MQVDYRIGIKYLIQQRKKEVENKIWEQWLMLYPHMQDKLDYQEYKNRMKVTNRLDKTEKARIDKNIDKINAAMRKKVSK